MIAKRNGMASTAQRHISHPPTANSACMAAILNQGDILPDLVKVI
jgi:hypothetical protein